MKARNLIRPSTAGPDQWLTTGAVAKRIGCSVRYVCKLIDQGRIIGIRLPYSKHRRVHHSALQDFIEHHGVIRVRKT
jgi:excisionase family DNA binding protein